MNTSQRGIDLIKQFEGFRASRYRDSAGVPTIGYGTTAAVVNPVPAKCTQAQAEQWLRTSIERKYEPPVNNIGVPLNQNRFDALVSFVYNLGGGVVGPDSTMGKVLRRQDWGAASSAFGLYVNAGGRRLPGLVNRRAAERKLFDTPAGDPPVATQPAAKAPAPAADPSLPTLRRGSTGEHVRRFQQRMIERGWESIGRPDGVFGPKTEKVVRAFQTEKFGAAGTDGVVGPRTWAEALRKDNVT